MPDTVAITRGFEAARALLLQHRWAAAAQAFRDLLRGDPALPGAHCGYGDALLRLRCWDDALREYERALELAPGSAMAQAGRARVLFQLGRCQESSAAFAQVTGAERVTSGPLAPPSSDALESFRRFVGDHSYQATEYFRVLMEELEWEGIAWISRLDEKKGASVWPLDRLIPGLTCLTMGPLEGSLEWELVRIGASRIVAIEGTRANFLKCHVLKVAFPHLPIEFVLGDVVTTTVSGTFDAVFCQGVLYHLSEPHILLERVFALTPKLLLLDTQLGVDASHPASEFRSLTDDAEIQWHGRTYRGRLFPEGPNPYLAGLDRAIPSIWLYPEELRRLLEDIGFKIEDRYEIDLGRLGLSGCYICTVPGAGRIHVSLGPLWRLRRWLYARLAPRLPMEKVGRTRLRG